VITWSSGRLTKSSAQPSAALPFPSEKLPFADFELQNLEGTKIHLSQYRGKAVIVNFWATWCEPCKAEMPLLEKAYLTYSGDLTILGVNVMERPEIVSPFLTQYGITFPILLDRDGAIENRYAVRGYPTSFFVDRDGVLQAQHIGELDDTLLAGYLQLIGVPK
jgi:thiol-disulfide isomerase/thioredoxin